MKYKVVATFVFEDVEADSPEDAQVRVDGTSFHSYIDHPKKDERVNPSYEVEQTEPDTGDYPSTEQLATIKNWDAADFHGLMEYIHPLWAFGAWGWSQDGDTYSISTGGWSGNEDIIAAMRSNHIWWAFHWMQSRRGGHYVFCKDMMSEKKEKE